MKKDDNVDSLSSDSRVSVKRDYKDNKITEVWLRVDGLYPNLIKGYISRINAAYPRTITFNHYKSTKIFNYRHYLQIMSLFKPGLNSEDVADILTDMETKAGNDKVYTGEQVRQIKSRLIQKFNSVTKKM